MKISAILEAARNAYTAGLCVIPVAEDGTKRPGIPSWKTYQTERPTREQEREWFSNSTRTGVGVICGAVSGNLECFEFDDESAYVAFKRRARVTGLGHLVERVEAGYSETTPGGGVHWLYRCESIGGNTKLTRRRKRPDEQGDPSDKVKVLIETRGEGGFVIVAPSNGKVHPTGGAYVLQSGGFGSMAKLAIEERESLFELARSFDEPPQLSTPPASTSRPSSSTRPGDDFNTRSSWAEVLAPAGWKEVYRHGETTFWQRPGKRAGISATTNHAGSDLLYVFSTSTDFDAERGYNRFSAYALLNHGGDFHEAARSLVAEGYGQHDAQQEVTKEPPEDVPSSDKKSAKKKADKQQGRELDLSDPDPADEQVDGAALLDDVVHLLERYIVMPPQAAVAVALWIVHTYLMDIWLLSPILTANSPTKRCGKTNLLKLVTHLCSRALAASNISSAALFRTIECRRPTLLLDEAETFLKDNEELRGIVNAGHTKATANVIRTVGEKHEPRIFSTWCAKFVALIGKLPDTLMDRSIVIPMRRKARTQVMPRLRDDRLARSCQSFRRRLVRWAADHQAELEDADPEVPSALNDRAADNWRPLLAVADAVGGEWPGRARGAATALSADDPEEDTLNVQLLWHINEVFREPEVECASADLVSRLTGRGDWPWATYSRNDKPITQNRLARMLKDFGVRPCDIKFDGKTRKGYHRTAFLDAWGRYPPSQPQQPRPTNKHRGETVGHNRNQGGSSCGCEGKDSPMNTGVVAVVAVETHKTDLTKVAPESSGDMKFDPTTAFGETPNTKAF